jgi:hypothetical protein
MAKIGVSCLVISEDVEGKGSANEWWLISQAHEGADW